MQRVNSLLSSWQRHRTILLVTPFVAAADQLSKLWVRHNLLPGESLPADSFFRLTHVRNEGIIFGIPANQILSLVLPIIVVVAALVLYFRYAPSNSRAMKIALGLFVGGSLGNLVDRLRFGYVTDFIDFHLWGNFHWPAFNLADLAIVMGAILFAYSVLRLEKSPKPG